MNTKIYTLSELKPAEYNPRKALKPGDSEYKKLKRSILEFGYAEPVIVNERTGNVVGGHQRLTVLKDLGHTELECVVLDLSLEQEKALNLALNKISGSWDEDKLKSLLIELEASDLDAELSGFSQDEIADLTELMDEGKKEETFDLSAALEEAAFVLPGDLWQVGKHRLYCGDTTKPADMDALLAGERPNRCVTDPPYNAAYESNLGLSIKNDKMESSAFYSFLLDSFKNIYSHLADDAAIYVFHSDTEGVNFRQSFLDAGFSHFATLAWIKNSLVLGRAPYQWQHEAVLYGAKGKPSFYGKGVSSLWFFNKPKKNDIHPTAKPIDLIEHPIRNSSEENGIVLDPFGGSGSCLIAAENLNRRARILELDPKYASVILRRYVAHTGSSKDVFCERGSYENLVKDVKKED